MFWKRPLNRRDGRRLLLIDGLQVFLAADLPLEDLDAVNRQDQRVLVLEPRTYPDTVMFTLYSPSAGNQCSTSIPPRVPSGSPSTCTL